MDAELGTLENPVTKETMHAVSYGHRFCKCSECGHTSRCRPGNDYYKWHDGGFRCEACVVIRTDADRKLMAK